MRYRARLGPKGTMRAERAAPPGVPVSEHGQRGARGLLVDIMAAVERQHQAEGWHLTAPVLYRVCVRDSVLALPPGEPAPIDVGPIRLPAADSEKGSLVAFADLMERAAGRQPLNDRVWRVAYPSKPLAHLAVVEAYHNVDYPPEELAKLHATGRTLADVPDSAEIRLVLAATEDRAFAVWRQRGDLPMFHPVTGSVPEGRALADQLARMQKAACVLHDRCAMAVPPAPTA
ncbi:hypothetical protein BAY61_13550 [Prauserella marina]|uniref:Uncharacterized protein n=2 Tax=Prauserella marina TaxID=530584 RepID=A0A222VPM9_9PSEU|nr:hypothetical protein [Prauserella marina]ASR35857.1 hypothetical protein BAY61_13550 [Prauserella marina]PWV84226.1 hypothetical protein DES30_101243 [Prauserella marina]SDC27598.1 hypothetical protein SAMN05421630_1011094 [Prauserella marina]